jgi:hypothetical protein
MKEAGQRFAAYLAMPGQGGGQGLVLAHVTPRVYEPRRRGLRKIKRNRDGLRRCGNRRNGRRDDVVTGLHPLHRPTLKAGYAVVQQRNSGNTVVVGDPGELVHGITIFGLWARAEGNWLSTASVIALMGDLGADAQAVRSSISRLKRRGVLVSERTAGVAWYSLSESALEILAEGDVRIFQCVRATEEDGWVPAVRGGQMICWVY